MKLNGSLNLYLLTRARLSHIQSAGITCCKVCGKVFEIGYWVVARRRKYLKVYCKSCAERVGVL